MRVRPVFPIVDDDPACGMFAVEGLGEGEGEFPAFAGDAAAGDGCIAVRRWGLAGGEEEQRDDPAFHAGTSSFI